MLLRIHIITFRECVFIIDVKLCSFCVYATCVHRLTEISIYSHFLEKPHVLN